MNEKCINNQNRKKKCVSKRRLFACVMTSQPQLERIWKFDFIVIWNEVFDFIENALFVCFLFCFRFFRNMHRLKICFVDCWKCNCYSIFSKFLWKFHFLMIFRFFQKVLDFICLIHFWIFRVCCLLEARCAWFFWYLNFFDFFAQLNNLWIYTVDCQVSKYFDKIEWFLLTVLRFFRNLYWFFRFFRSTRLKQAYQACWEMNSKPNVKNNVVNDEEKFK